MNKLKLLQKQLMIKGAIALGVILAFTAIYFFVSDMTDDFIKQKTDGDTALAGKSGERDQMKAKIDGAEQSEKNYVAVLLIHPDKDFSTTRDELVQFLNDAKATRRLDNLKLTISPEAIAKDTVLTSADSEVPLHDDTSIEFDAISDVQVYAFLDDLVKKSPGFIHLKAISMQRKSDLTPAVITQLGTGAMADNVSVKVTVLWAGVRNKEAPPASAASPAANAVVPAGTVPNVAVGAAP